MKRTVSPGQSLLGHRPHAVVVAAVLLAACAALTAWPVRAFAQACPSGNVLAGAAPMRATETLDAARTTDGTWAAEGDFWKSGVTSQLTTNAAEVVYDLKQLVRLSGMVVQADANDTYQVSTSRDGQQWETVWEVQPARGHGMRLRHNRSLDIVAQFIRVSDPAGDGSYSLAEVAAYCELPKSWPPQFERAAKAASKGGVLPKLRMAGYKVALGFLALFAFTALFRLDSTPRSEVKVRRQSRVLMIAAALAALVGALLRAQAAHLKLLDGWKQEQGAGFLLWSVVGLALVLWVTLRVWRKEVWSARGDKWLERAALLSLMLAGLLGWTSFLEFHGGGNPIHMHEAFHYQMGAKYFPENRYSRMYECAALAEAEAGRRRSVERRNIRDLDTYALHVGPHALEDPSLCKKHFTKKSWHRYKGDVEKFRGMFTPAHWHNVVFSDHGYNATPVWNMVGHWVTRPTSVSRPTIVRLALIDPILYLLVFGMIGWAFGMRATALAMVVWGTGFPWNFYYNGGAFMRLPYLATAVVGLCLLKKAKPLMSGFFLGWSVLLRWFPASFVFGIMIQLVHTLFRTRRWSREQTRLVLGGVLSVALLVPASAHVAGGFSAYEELFEKVSLHAKTPFTNHMGLTTLFAWNPNKSAAKLNDPSDSDPYGDYKRARYQTFQDRRVFYWAAVALIMGLFALFAVSHPAWATVAMGPLIVFLLFEPACYYYTMVVMLAPFAVRRREFVEAMLAMSILTQVARVSAGQNDQGYAACAAIVGACMLYVLVASIWYSRSSRGALVGAEPVS